jgi:hypothetical protein
MGEAPSLRLFKEKAVSYTRSGVSGVLKLRLLLIIILIQGEKQEEGG